MRKTFITGNQRLVRVYCGVIAVIAALIIGGHFYFYAKGELSSYWYLDLFLAIMSLIWCLPEALGWKKPGHPEIHLDSEKMEWKGSARSAPGLSFKWSKLKRVEFDGRKLQVTFAMTGASDSMKIPYLTDTLTMKALKQSIREACEHHEIAFSTK